MQSALVVLGIVMALEPAAYLAALIMFPHLDTPDCAGTDTFCSPDGRPGPTGGAMVVIVGTRAVMAFGCVLVVRLRLGGRRRSASAS